MCIGARQMKFDKSVLKVFSSHYECCITLVDKYDDFEPLDIIWGHEASDPLYQAIDVINNHLEVQQDFLLNNFFTSKPLNIKELLGVPQEVGGAVKLLKKFVKEGVKAGCIKISKKKGKV